MTKMEIKNKHLSILQFVLAAIIVLLYQFVFPLCWQPLDYFTYGDVPHGTPGTNIVMFTISDWFFAFSVVWFIYRDNPYINNFLVYGIIPLGLIWFAEFFILFLYIDYIHVFPFFLSIYILIKKRNTLTQKYTPFFILFLTTWFFSVYFLELAYYQAPLNIFIFNYLINFGISLAISFSFGEIKKKHLSHVKRMEKSHS